MMLSSIVNEKDMILLKAGELLCREQPLWLGMYATYSLLMKLFLRMYATYSTLIIKDILYLEYKVGRKKSLSGNVYLFFNFIYKH